MSYAELARMSQIKDRNIHAQTDQLYEPLRNALRKSTVSQSLLFPQMNISKVGRQMRSLSPVEAEIIKRNLYIPVNKQLVPTRNIQKVLGKNFTAVDVSEKVKQALTPQQFNSMRHGTTQEIIYEIKDQPVKNQNIYTSRENIPTSIYNISSPLRQSKVLQVEQNRFANFITPSHNRESQVNFTMHGQSRMQNQVRVNGQSQMSRQNPIHIAPQPLRLSQVNLKSQHNHQSNIYTQPHQLSAHVPQNNLYINKNPRESLITMDRNGNRISSPTTRPEGSKQNANRSMTSITALRNDVNLNQGTMSVVKSESSSKLYDFRASKVSDNTTKNSRKSKDEYKYNLFSALDEAGNTHCRSGCFHSNQIVASKIQHNPWK